LKELANDRIFVINHKQLTAEQRDFVTSYFRRHVRPNLMPIMLDQTSKFPNLRDDSIFLATRFEPAGAASKARYALVEVPLKGQRRFLLLPSIHGDEFIILIDDVIRCCLKDIFPLFEISAFEAYTIKVTRDAELDIDNDLSESYVRKISRSLKQRKQGNPVRFVYDGRIPAPLLKFLVKKLGLAREDTLIPGSEYHNFRDFMQFPDVGPPVLREKLPPPLPHKDIHQDKGLIRSMAESDILLHFPYHSFDHLLALLREAAIDPRVTAIKTTLYRMARNSGVVKALINAVKNGKEVTAVVELQARFDEEANIQLAAQLQEEGARVIYGVPGLKVHAKLCLIVRREKRKQALYAALATGNFNEDTSPVYSDHLLLTADRRLTSEVSSVFHFLENKYPAENYQHLIVSPFNARRKLTKLIKNEIKNAQNGREARIFLKANNLTDPELIRSLYRASSAGVQIRLIVRGMFSLIPGLPNLSQNIEGISIVDRFLEHSRIMVFHNGGSPKYFLASGDWMTRNLDGRVEVAFPVYDPNLQNELRAFLAAQWNDNVKARILNKDLDNQYRQTPYPGKTRAQETIYEFLKALHSGKETEPVGRPGPRLVETETDSTRVAGASE
jgi:polyphosphate kinase